MFNTNSDWSDLFLVTGITLFILEIPLAIKILSKIMKPKEADTEQVKNEAQGKNDDQVKNEAPK